MFCQICFLREGGYQITDLIVVDIIARPSVSCGEEGYTSSESQTTHSNVSDSAAYYRQAFLLQYTVYIIPSGSRTDRSLCFMRRYDDLIQVEQVDGDSSIDIGGTGKGGMSAALNCKLTLLALKDLDGDGDVLCTGGGYAAGGYDRSLLLGPISRFLEFVNGALRIGDFAF